MLKEKSDSLGRAVSTDVWFVDVAACTDALGAWQDQVHALDDATKARLARIKHDKERQTRFTVHNALRAVIEQIKGPTWRGKPLMYSDKGQPSLPGLGLSVSLSHTDGAGLIALSSAPAVGVDVEPRDRRVKMQADRQHAIISAASALECSASDRQPAQLEFLSAWVRLEAFGKATGHGLAPLLAEAMAPLRKRGLQPKVRDLETPADALMVYDLDVPADFVAALALERGALSPKVHRFPEAIPDLTALLGTS